MNAGRTDLRGHAARILLAPLVAALGAVAFPHAGPGVLDLGTFWLNSLMVALFGVILALFRPEIYRSGRGVVFFALGMGAALAAAGLVARFAPLRTELIPVALPTFLFAVLYDERIAAVAAMALAVLIGAQPAFAGTDALAFCFVGGVGAALTMGRIRSRTQAWRFVLTVAAIYAATAAVSGFAAHETFRAMMRSAGLGGLNALGSAALAMLLLPLGEAFTRSTTDLRLLELSDPSRTLLRRLATEAPGTWAHSLSMANLCEAACNVIGANGLLARVGCYYHDIGKLASPRHFIENMGRGPNPHATLEPEESATIIRRHVEDGLALAAEHHLPDAVRSFIPEHHGTQEIRYFLERQRERFPGAVVGPAFRYPGPLPQSAETAVALLADAAEAAVRVLDEPTPELIDDVLSHLVAGRVEAGQLREAPLSLREVEAVRQELVRGLAGMHHHRIEYPEDAGGITADWEVQRR